MLATPGGTSGPGTFRRLNKPRAVEVRVAAGGSPGALRRGDGWRAVEEVLDHYRTEDRWWTAKPVSRAYYELLLEDGRAVTVFRDKIKGSWWEQRYG